MKMKLAIIALFLLTGFTAFAMPSASSKPSLESDVKTAAPPSAPPVVSEQQVPLERDSFVWQDSDSKLHHAEANRRLMEGLGRCSQFAVVTWPTDKKTVHDVYFKVGENRSPWPIGRIELEPKDKTTKVSIGQNKQFSMGSGKFQRMWAGYLDEKYECPPKPGKHSGGMHHP